jgi:hypothetical protein
MKMNREERDSLIKSEDPAPLKFFYDINIRPLKVDFYDVLDKKEYRTMDTGMVYVIHVEANNDLKKTVHADLMSITEDGTTIFEYDGVSNVVSIQFYVDTIEIDSVAIEREGICTRSVAYTMKALLHYINKQKRFAPVGEVNIVSKKPIAAFNCYHRAFKLNGYKIDEDEYVLFKAEYDDYKADRPKKRRKKHSSGRVLDDERDDKFNFTFENFTSEEQRSLRPKLKF